ncbi:hypothetical protein ALC53_12486 [Atta colombica]|uniref:Uncharacterized protein n=1 Tax=Atta colombica TaxID=520822 RepID=A0A195AYB7_9HYME|nr:hypothetical protein ALC53_12486 [Atta colombica]
MIKLNNICIQYTAWCRRDTATSLTHTPWSTRLGPARSQHRKSDETIHRIRGIDPRNGIGESGWENIFSLIVWLTAQTVPSAVARTVAKGCKTITHSPGSVACGYPDRSITRVGVSKQEFPTYPSTRLRDRSIEYRRDGSDFDVSHTTTIDALSVNEKKYKEQSTGLNDESTVFPRFQCAIDLPGESLSSSIGRFWRRRMAGR